MVTKIHFILILLYSFYEQPKKNGFSLSFKYKPMQIFNKTQAF